MVRVCICCPHHPVASCGHPSLCNPRTHLKRPTWPRAGKPDMSRKGAKQRMRMSHWVTRQHDAARIFPAFSCQHFAQDTPGNSVFYRLLGRVVIYIVLHSAYVLIRTVDSCSHINLWRWLVIQPLHPGQLVTVLGWIRNLPLAVFTQSRNADKFACPVRVC